MAASEITARFGASIRSLRQSLGISQETLAERADLHRTYIAGIEGGSRNVTLKSMDKLARALQVSTATLLLRAAPATPPGEPPSIEISASDRVDILLIEDDRTDVELTMRAFKRARIINPFHVAYDGLEALDFLFCTGPFARRKMKDRPQLVLLDLNLPKLGGVEVLRRIKADERTRFIPVVVLTSSRNARDLAECQRLGAKTFIVKPLDLEGLSRATTPLDLDWMLLKHPAPTSPHARTSAAL